MNSVILLCGVLQAAGLPADDVPATSAADRAPPPERVYLPDPENRSPDSVSVEFDRVALSDFLFVLARLLGKPITAPPDLKFSISLRFPDGDGEEGSVDDLLLAAQDALRARGWLLAPEGEGFSLRRLTEEPANGDKHRRRTNGRED